MYELFLTLSLIPVFQLSELPGGVQFIYNLKIFSQITSKKYFFPEVQLYREKKKTWYEYFRETSYSGDFDRERRNIEYDMRLFFLHQHTHTDVYILR